jgi:hypothetical protein
VFQFSVSLILIVGVLVIYKQINYVQTKNLGYSRDNILQFEPEANNNGNKNFYEEGGTLEKYVETYVNEVRGIPGVLQAANFEHNLMGTHGHGEFEGLDWKEGDEDEQMQFANLEVGYEFLETMNIQLAAGRSFSPQLGNERLKVL